MLKNCIKITGVLFLAVLLFSCDELVEDETMSIKDRIEAFEDDLNDGNYDDLQDHFHPDMTGYDNYEDETVLSTGFLGSSNAPFSFGSPDTSSNADETMDATGSFSHGGGADGSYEAIMKEDGDDNWKILEMDIKDSPTDDDPFDIRQLF